MNHALGVHKSHPELSPITEQSTLLLLNARACPITTTHKAILAPAQQGTEGTCQHIPPERFLLYPRLTHHTVTEKTPISAQPGACLYQKEKGIFH